ncbi:MAG: hypothetical protein U0556_00340 [Dehalococcoidia bacterium]
MPTDLDLVRQISAATSGNPVPKDSRLHLAIRPNARLICPIEMAGEDGSVQIVATGPIGQPPAIYCVPEPRDRDCQGRLAGWLGRELLALFEETANEGTYPQIWTQSASSVDLLDTLSDRYRWSRVSEARLLGELLTYPAERLPLLASKPCSRQRPRCACTGRPGLHPKMRSTSALLAWLDPPDGVSPRDAARVAERTPMGINTDPDFDRFRLDPAVSAYTAATRQSDHAAARRAELTIREILTPVVTPIYEAVQRAISYLQAANLPPLPELTALERREAAAFAWFMDQWRKGMKRRQRDSPARATREFALREIDQENYDAARITGDPLVRVAAELDGRVLRGVMTECGVNPNGKVWLALESEVTALRLRPGDRLVSLDGGLVKAAVRTIVQQGSTARVVLDLSARRPALPSHGTPLSFGPPPANWGKAARLGQRLKGRLTPPPWTHGANLPSSTPRLPPADPLALVESL